MEQMNYTPPTAPVPPAQPVYAKGCLGAAWDDIKATPGYIGKLAVLGLIMCVPILNFVVYGYLLFWSREVPFGGRTPLPGKYVTGKNFEFGFYAFVLGLAVSLVAAVVSGIFGLIPLLGSLVAIAVELAASVLMGLMSLRMIMGLSLAEGFKLKDLWEKGRRNVGQLLLAALVPNLVLGVIAVVVLWIVMLFMLLIGFGAGLPALISSSTGTGSMADAMAVFGFILGPVLIGFLIVYVICCLMGGAATALSYRALGHWVARYASEWTALAPAVPPVPPVPPVTPPTPPAGPTYPQTPGM